MPSCSRRALLGAGATATLSTLAGCSGPNPVSVSSWTPETDAWPLARYGPRNTGYNPHATPPETGVQQTWTVTASVPANGLRIADGLLTVHGREGLAVLRLEDRTLLREQFVPAQAAGIIPGPDGEQHLYAAGPLGVRDGTQMQFLRAWRYRPPFEEQSLWLPYEGADRLGPAGLVGNDETVFVGHYADRGHQLTAVDVENGSVRWQIPGRYPTVGGEALFVSGTGGVSRYRPRSGDPLSFKNTPPTVWTSRYAGDTVASVANGRVLVGGDWDPSGNVETVYAYDARSGELLWEPRSFDSAANAPAIRGTTAFLSTVVSAQYEGYYLPASGQLRAVDLQDGSVAWTRETAWIPETVVLGDTDVVIMGGGYPDGDLYPANVEDTGGRIRAYDTASGHPRWTVRTDHWIESLAVVGSRVYAGASDGTIYRLDAKSATHR